MIKVSIAPRRYVQGAGVLDDMGKYIAPLGKRVLVAWGPAVSEQFNDRVKKSFAENELELISGIGDGLANWFEAEAACKGRRVALAGGVATQAALTLAFCLYYGFAPISGKVLGCPLGSNINIKYRQHALKT